MFAIVSLFVELNKIFDFENHDNSFSKINKLILNCIFFSLSRLYSLYSLTILLGTKQNQKMYIIVFS